MNWKGFLQTWEGTRFENTWLRVFCATLLAIIVILLVLVFRKETIVTVQPFTLKSEAWVAESNASESYKKAWGLALAQLLGNVQPATVSFLKETLAPFLAPRIYQETLDVLEVQAMDIKKDRVVMRFEPRSILFEENSNKIFVEGTSHIKGASASKETSNSRVYEFVIGVEGYMPEIQHIATYEGRAKTADVLQREAAQTRE